MIVVDANVIAYLLIEGEYSSQACALRQSDPMWIVPTLCRHELANVIATYVKHGAMDVNDVPRLWQSVEMIVTGNEYDVDLSKAIAIAAGKGLSAYDAQYMSLSLEMAIPLITQDKKLAGKSENAFSLPQFLKH